VNDQCWYPLTGCLDPEAYNYGCEAPGDTVCNGGLTATDKTRVTVHEGKFCSYIYPSPPSPPPPSIPPNAVVTKKGDLITVSVQVADTFECSETYKTDLQKSIATEYNVPTSAVTVTCTAVTDDTRRRRLAVDYIDIEITIDTSSQSPAEQEATAASVQTAAGDTSTSASTFFQVDETEVIGPPETVVEPILIFSPAPSPPIAPPPKAPKDDDEVPVGAIVGGVLGGLALCACIAVAVVYMQRSSKASKTGPAY